MKRKIAVLLLSFILILAFWGAFRWTVSYDYVSEQSIYEVVGRYKFLLGTSAICFTVMLHFVPKKLFKKRQFNSKNKFFIWFTNFAFLIILPLAFFFVNAGLLLFSNMFFQNKPTLHINGIVVERTETYNSKGGTIHYLGIKNLVTEQGFRFKVRKLIFEQYKMNDTVVKDFEVSGLGIIYRKNP